MNVLLREWTEDEFDDRVTLIPNHLNAAAGWTNASGQGCLFETHGDELEFVLRQDPQRIWTLLDDEYGELYLLSGCHYVNRIGYLLTHELVAADVVYRVRLAGVDSAEAA